MDPIVVATIGLAALAALLVLRIPLAVAMMLVGMTGYVVLHGLSPLLDYMKTGAYWRFASYDFSVIPMFLLMGQLAARSGLSRDLFDAANAVLGRRRGGAAMAAVGGCGAFGAICGSSLATSGTMARVALPELRRLRYSGSLATGAIAAGGTLGILIPPSVVLIIYAVAVQANIVRMFEAALVPGLLALFGYFATIMIYVRWRPESAPAIDADLHTGSRRAALRSGGPVAALFVAVVGGIYAGWFDPTEAAAVGVLGAAALARIRGQITGRQLAECCLDTAVMTGAIFMILLGADFINIFLALAGFPEHVAGLAAQSGWHPYAILIAMVLFYLVLGCFMDSLAMIFLTVPVFWPIVAALDFGMPLADVQIWFGIIVLVVVEMGLITPPIGLNVLIINSQAEGVSLRETYAGVAPFLASDVVRVVLLIALPGLTLWLPHALA